MSGGCTITSRAVISSGSSFVVATALTAASPGGAIIVFTQTQSPLQAFFTVSEEQSLHGISQGGVFDAAVMSVAGIAGQAANADAAGARTSAAVSARLRVQFAIVRASHMSIEAYYTSSALGHR